MPRQVTDIKQFLELARRPDAKSVRVKKSKSTKAGSAPVTKFKVRCSKHLHTLIVKESDKADKLRQSLPPTLKVEDIGKTAAPKKKA